MYCLLLQTTQWHSIYHHLFHISCDTLHIKYEQTQWNVTNKISQYLLCLSGCHYCKTENYAELSQFSTCETTAFILHTNTVIWTLSLSGTQQKYLCLCFVHSTIICSMICQNSPAVSKTIIQATRTVSFASLRINCDDIPKKHSIYLSVYLSWIIWILWKYRYFHLRLCTPTASVCDFMQTGNPTHSHYTNCMRNTLT